MIKIAKFGGSSVADAEHFKKIKAIVDADPARRFVVVSACGRRFKGDTKVTDLLTSPLTRTLLPRRARSCSRHWAALF